MRAHILLLFASTLAAHALFACSSDDTAAPPASGDSGTPPANDAAANDAEASNPRPPFDGRAPEIACAVTPCITRLVAGPTHYCAIANDGVVRCWGNPSALGEFGTKNPSGDPGATPVLLDGIRDILDLAGSALQTCVVRNGGTVECFGRDTPKPTAVPGVSGATKVTVGEDRSCAIGAAGGIACWGDSEATGKGNTTVTLAGDTATSVWMTTPIALAIASSGALFSWGREPTMLGRDTSLPVDWTPGRVLGMSSTLQVAASDMHVCALTTEGRLYCWGHGENGALGLGAIRSVSVPTEVFFAGPAWPQQIAVASTHSCARMTDGALMCWARVDASGELGRSETTGVFIPTSVAVNRSVAAVATGTGSTCALMIDGSVQCWGSNVYGQLGVGRRDSERHYLPTTVVFP